MRFIHAQLISIYRCIPKKVLMTFKSLDNENDTPFQIDIYTELTCMGITISQKFVCALQENLQGKKFLIREDTDGMVTIDNLYDRIRECRS